MIYVIPILSQKFCSILGWESGFTTIPQLEKVENSICLKLSDYRTGLSNLQSMSWMWPITQSHPTHNPNKKIWTMKEEESATTCSVADVSTLHLLGYEVILVMISLATLVQMEPQVLCLVPVKVNCEAEKEQAMAIMAWPLILTKRMLPIPVL